MSGKMYDFRKFAKDATASAWFVMNLATGKRIAGPFKTRGEAATAGGRIAQTKPELKKDLYVSLRDITGDMATDPPVSEAQRKAMFAAKSGNSTLGIPQKVGAEFAKADPGGKLPARKR